MSNIEQVSASTSFGGKQLRFKHSSAFVGCDMHFSVYLPPQALEANAGKLPVLYWLSGLTCSDENFVTKAGAQQFAAQEGLIIIAPDTSPRGDQVPDDPNQAYDFGLGAGFYVDATQEPWRKNYQMYSYITDELYGLINANFPVNTKAVGISGHSMGGHGALTIALKNPDKYSSASAFSPIVSPMNCPWGEKALSNYIGNNKADWANYDACELIASAQSQLPILVDQGLADNFLDEQLKTQLLVDAAKAASYPIDIRMHEGYDHSYFFISTFIQSHIQFHSRNLQGQ